MKTRKLGNLTVSSIGLGCMGMSGMYGSTSEQEAIATIHKAIEFGATNGAFYGERYPAALMQMVNI